MTQEKQRDTQFAAIVNRYKRKLRKKIRRLRKRLGAVRREVWIALPIALQFVILGIYLLTLPKINLGHLRHYRKKFACEEVKLCGTGAGKPYEDYRKIDDPASKQWALIHNALEADPRTGFLLDQDGFIAAALGYQFGEIGTRYYFTLDSGIVLPLIKADAKDPRDASDGCVVDINGTVIEFVIDAEAAGRYFGIGENGYVLNGSFNNDKRLQGSIVKIEKVLQ